MLALLEVSNVCWFFGRSEHPWSSQMRTTLLEFEVWAQADKARIAQSANWRDFIFRTPILVGMDVGIALRDTRYKRRRVPGMRSCSER
ncbi:hypothetical protein PCAR4_460052 [Paraburkholderia caribensis]|nr:hypothetical protein PCAR4_460052 [Paraburkholderia caribensis]